MESTSASTSGKGRHLLLILLLATNAIPTLSSSSSPLSSSQSRQQITATKVKEVTKLKKCPTLSASWGLLCRDNHHIFATKIVRNKNVSTARQLSSTLLPLSSSLSYMRRLRINAPSSWNGVIDSIRGGGGDDLLTDDDEEEYDIEDETDDEDVDESSDDDEEESDVEESDEEESDEEESDEEESDDGDTDDDTDEIGQESSEGEYEDDEYDEDEESEYDEDEGDHAGAMAPSIKSRGESGTEQVYDEPLALSSMQDMGVTMVVLVLCNKLDLTNTRIIRYARFAFIAYVILAQLFLIFTRLQAHKINDRTPITISNPLSNMLQSQIGSAVKGDMVKNMANSILSSESTIMEYDLSQAKNLNNSLLLPMVMLYFLHFKMGQVQPLIYQSVNGFKALLTSPLFQVYALGRNLERPFRNPQADKMKQTLDEKSGEVPESQEDVEIVQVEDESDEEDVEESDTDNSDDDDSDYSDSDEYDDDSDEDE